jgi:hypothetical protein
MIPGDDAFPSASAVGAHGLVATRLRQRLGRQGLDRLGAALGPLAPLDAARRKAAIERLESTEPELFALLRTTVYLSYYEQPAVVDAVRALGHAYNDAPQPEGYALDPFDPAIDLPAAPRGHYVATEEVRRVDLAGLDLLPPGGR